ncbi:MAG: S9 family peptidase [Bacteroidetes bacterium]|nr:S9 family peptidase [Bacteroidota bacterium]
MRKFNLLLLFSLFAFSGLQSQERISLENIWLYYRYYPTYVSEFKWMNDDQYYTILEEDRAISRFSIENEQKVDEILNLSELNLGGNTVESYEFSADENAILLKTGVEAIYRHSTRETCFIVDLKSKKITPVNQGKKISNPTFSPNGSKLGYVFENNLYYQDANTGKVTQITFDGKPNAIINGATDWVYEEEFAFEKAFAWSPDGKQIAFYRFDESEVREFSMEVYGSLYPGQYRFKYPKAGEKNAVVSIHVFDLTSNKTVMADLGPEKDQYIARIKWTQSSDELAAMRLNRLQNQVDVLLINANTGKSNVILTEKSETYIKEATDDKWFFLKESEDFLWTSEMNGYNHIYRYGRDGELKKAITEGNYEVSGIVGIDEENDRIYYMSKEDSPKENHLYTISLKGKKKKKLTTVAGVHEITASSRYNYFVDTYSNLDQPPVTDLKDSNGKVIKVLENNENLSATVKNLSIQKPEFFNFQTSEGVTLDGWMIKPADFDSAKQYPVLMYVYGGPGDQKVLNEWGTSRTFDYFWYQMLAQNGYIVACVDNRGTGGKGRDFRAVTYANLGKYETIDQIEAAKYLGNQSYIDASRIGIWGWSYGGYMTSLCMTKGNGLFKAGIAVAPVTNWRFYDTIYTERYLKTPQLNPSGYDENSPLNFAANLQGAYLLVHGMADDNVHVQNSIEWVDALVRANKQFDMFFYPNKNHSIFGGYTRYHLYKKMTDFIFDNL